MLRFGASPWRPRGTTGAEVCCCHPGRNHSKRPRGSDVNAAILVDIRATAGRIGGVECRKLLFTAHAVTRMAERAIRGAQIRWGA